MRVLDRYLARGFLAPFFYCLAVFSILFIVIDYFNNLDDFLRNNAAFKVVLSYYMSLFPVLVIQVVPIAALVAMLFLLSMLNKNNELIAMKASGINTLSIITPFLFIGLVCSFAVMLVNETVIPNAILTSTSIKDGLIHSGKTKLEQRAIKNVTLAADSRMIFAREYEVVTQTLYDVDIEDVSSRHYKIKIKARRAVYEDGQWQLYDALKQRLNVRGEIVGQPVYSPRLVMELNVKPEQFIHEASQVEFMSAKELKEYIGNFRGSASKRLADKLWVDFHNKIAIPFITLIMILIGAPLAMRTERGTVMLGIGTSLIVVFLYYALDSIFLAMGKGGHLSPFIAAWTANVLFGLVGIVLIRQSS